MRNVEGRVGAIGAAGVAFWMIVGAVGAMGCSDAAEGGEDESGEESGELSSSVTTATVLDGRTKIGVYLSGNVDTSNTYSNSKMGSLYLSFGNAVPVSTLKTRLGHGESLHISFNVKGTTYSYINGLVAGEDTAKTTLAARVAELVTLANYAKSLNNNTYVVASLLSEASGQTLNGNVPGIAPDDPNAPVAIGKAEQVFVRAVKAAKNPHLFASIWLMGYNVTWERTQTKQVTNPKPDVITWDPYENHICTGSLSTITAGGVNASYAAAYIKSLPAYNGRLAISEFGMATANASGVPTCTDTQLAAFYTDLHHQLDAMQTRDGVRPRFIVMFNGTGRFKHDITNGDYPKAKAALQASLTKQ